MPSSTGTFNIVVFGEPSVGKTCFIDQFCYGKSFVTYDPGNSVLSNRLIIEGQAFSLTLMDLSTSFMKPEQAMHSTEWAEKMLAEAEGVVLLYNITSSESFQYVTDQAYKLLWRSRKNDEENGEVRMNFGCVLVGNKLDLVIAGNESRAVSKSLADEWAQTQGMRSIEVDSLRREGPERALKLLVQNIKMIERLEGRAEKRFEEETLWKETKSLIRSSLKVAPRLSRS
jgi:Ras-related protein Rab-39B